MALETQHGAAVIHTPIEPVGPDPAAMSDQTLALWITDRTYELADVDMAYLTAGTARARVFLQLQAALAEQQNRQTK